LRLEYEPQILETTRDLDNFKRGVVDGRKLNNLQIDDTNRLKMELSAMKKGNEM